MIKIFHLQGALPPDQGLRPQTHYKHMLCICHLPLGWTPANSEADQRYWCVCAVVIMMQYLRGYQWRRQTSSWWTTGRRWSNWRRPGWNRRHGRLPMSRFWRTAWTATTNKINNNNLFNSPLIPLPRTTRVSWFHKKQRLIHTVFVVIIQHL